AGIAVGGSVACSYAYVRIVTPDDQLGKALGRWAAITAVVVIPLTIVGSGLAGLNWRAAFLLIPIAALACLVATPRLLPFTAPVAEKRQLLGVSLAGLGVVGLLYGISQTADHIVAEKTVIPVGVGILLVAAAAMIGLRSKNPSFPVRLFRNPQMLAASLAGGLWNLALAVAILQSSNLWQYVNGVTPLYVSLLQLPTTLAIAVGSVVAGRLLSRRIDFRLLMFIGFAVAASGFALMGAASDAAVTVWFNIGMVGGGLGAGAAGTVQSKLLLSLSPPKYLGSVSASRTTFGQIGYAIGLAGSAVITTVFTIRHLAGTDSHTFATAREELNAWFISNHQDAALSDAYQQGFARGMLVWTGVMLVGALICVVLTSMKSGRGTMDESLGVQE
ncbi:MAG: MFS transporter, partial [Candidatus Nanopelagicales bacterium]|nr:MFS transporter [Candidatus Nanopelagicales bacterium]